MQPKTPTPASLNLDAKCRIVNAWTTSILAFLKSTGETVNLDQPQAKRIVRAFIQSTKHDTKTFGFAKVLVNDLTQVAGQALRDVSLRDKSYHVAGQDLVQAHTLDAPIVKARKVVARFKKAVTSLELFEAGLAMRLAEVAAQAAEHAELSEQEAVNG